jgi:hypothetical protein
MSQAARPATDAPRTSGKAVTSLILGCASFVGWIFTGLPAVVLGIMALRDIKRSGGRLEGDGIAIAGIVTGGITSLLIVPVLILVALLLPAVQAAREAARRSMATSNMHQIMLAVQNYETVHDLLPAAGGGEGPGSQLSWRVHILPYLEGDEAAQFLYHEFHLDEPWDSEHNRALIAKMPQVYRDPADRIPPGETLYLAVKGPGTAFEDGNKGVSIRKISDGTSNTVAIVEADPNEAAVWTKPDDWQYDPKNPTRGLGSARPAGFLAGMVDGSVQMVPNDAPIEVIKAMMNRGDGGREGPTWIEWQRQTQTLDR